MMTIVHRDMLHSTLSIGTLHKKHREGPIKSKIHKQLMFYCKIKLTLHV